MLVTITTILTSIVKILASIEQVNTPLNQCCQLWHVFFPKRKKTILKLRQLWIFAEKVDKNVNVKDNV